MLSPGDLIDYIKHIKNLSSVPDSIKILEAPRFSCRLGTPYMSASTKEGEDPLGNKPQGILISYGVTARTQPN